MQNTPFEFPHFTWSHLITGAITAILAYGARSIVLLKRGPSEIHETEARARKIEAEARQIDTNSVLQFVDRLTKQQLKVDELQQLNDKLESELKLAELQRKNMKALLDIHGIKYSEFDE